MKKKIIIFPNVKIRFRIRIGNFIWADLYPPNGSSKFPDVKLDDAIDSFSYQWTSKTGQGLSQKTYRNITVTSSMAKNWYKNLRQKILAVSSVQELEPIQKLLAILVLKLLRYLLHDAIALENHILETVTDLAGKFAMWNVKEIIPPANQNCFSIQTVIKERQNEISTVFAMLSHAMMNESAAAYKIYAPIMETSCMAAFQYFGFGPFKWLFSASKYQKANPKKLMKYFHYDLTAGEYERMINHLNTYKNCKSWQYARLIDPDYFVELNVTDNPRLTMIFAHLSKPKSDWDEIKKIKSLGKKLSYIDFGKEYAEAFLKAKPNLKHKLETDSGSDYE